jgi:hypothetical protein
VNRTLLAAAPLVLLLAGMSAASCPGAKIKVTLVVILAKEDGNAIDPRLKEIAAEVRKRSPGLKSFQLKTMTCKSIPPGEKTKFPAVDDQTTQLVVRHGADPDNRVELAVTAPGQGEIVYETVCGKFLPIVTRHQTKSKERLILAIRVQPCNGD